MHKRYLALSAALAALLMLCACRRAPVPPPDASSSPDPSPASAVTDPPPSSEPAPVTETPVPDTADGTERFGGTLSEEGLGFSFVPAEGFTVPREGPPFRYTRGDAFVEIGYDPSALPEELAPSFMNGYIAFTDIEFSSCFGIGEHGQLSAETVTAGDGSSVLSAYLINDGNSCIWLLFSCPADDAETMREMDAMRDSFNILAG
ncbi:MAG: hypothetical protein ILP09_05525 [Oscillospiraceae bacterium]|nr:hypothetical protein [Oscillospiraceae bacterium]